ncbi:hypothetical protein Tco_1354557 [Tanacetum coccineum]
MLVIKMFSEVKERFERERKELKNFVQRELIFAGNGALYDGQKSPTVTSGGVVPAVPYIKGPALDFRSREVHRNVAQAKGSSGEGELVFMNVVFDGAFEGVGDEEVVVGEGVNEVKENVSDEGIKRVHDLRWKGDRLKK